MESDSRLIKKAVVMAGGRGRRLGPYTWVLPKPLMPIGDMPVLELLLRQLAHFKIAEVTLAVGYRAEYIRAFVGDGARYGLDVRYVQESQPLGTAGPLALIDGLNEPFLVMNGDLVTSLDFGKLLDFHLAQHAAATVATYRRTVQISLGVLQTDPEGQVTGWIEKPSYDYQVSMGINVLTPELLSYVTPGQYLDLPDLIKHALSDGRRVVAYPFVEGYWLDIGRPEDYEQIMRDIDSLMPNLLPGWTPPQPSP